VQAIMTDRRKNKSIPVDINWIDFFMRLKLLSEKNR